MFHVKHFYDYKTTLPTCFSKFVKLIQLTFTNNTLYIKKRLFFYPFFHEGIFVQNSKNRFERVLEKF